MLALRTLLITILLFATAALSHAQRSTGPVKGTLIVDGGGSTDLVKNRFVERAGGAQAHIVVIPTGASSVRFGDDKIILDPDWPRDRTEWKAYEAYLKHWFGVEDVIVIHTRDRKTANSDQFIAPLRKATGVFLGAGNSGRIAVTFLETRTQLELEALLARGGVVFGSSAGAIIQGSYTVRGRPDKPLLMAKGHERGFAFMKNVAINPHLTQAKRDNELINVIDSHPKLLGIGIDEDAALIVEGNRFEVIGAGRVAIYDNQKRDGSWYYWLKPGDRFDLSTWTKEVTTK
ncbi:MAG TPA: cyanophycinase [Pyrinomonadaceae bacterium]|nr:cyanophycinase [Pyrinomonadaceae bacterium]